MYGKFGSYEYTNQGGGLITYRFTPYQDKNEQKAKMNLLVSPALALAGAYAANKWLNNSPRSGGYVPVYATASPQLGCNGWCKAGIVAVAAAAIVGTAGTSAPAVVPAATTLAGGAALAY